MVYSGNLIVVKDIDKAVEFYNKVLGLEVICDFGANKTLTGGFSLQTLQTWKDFIDKKEEDILFKSHAYELYFEEDNLDAFLEKLKSFPFIEFVHGIKEHSWGQRTIRFYDLDKHIIEVGENMEITVMRFIKGGMNIEQTAKRMDVPKEYIESVISKF